MSQAFGGSRSINKPPEKGVFPLDHFGECKKLADTYMKCVENSDYSSKPCREISKQYLICRMNRNLMADQSLEELGFQGNKQ